MSTMPPPQRSCRAARQPRAHPSGGRAGRAARAPRWRGPGRSPVWPTNRCRRSRPSSRRLPRSSAAPRPACARGGSRSRAGHRARAAPAPAPLRRRHAAADHVDAEPAGELARARHVRRADPRRVGRDGEPVTLEQRHGDPEVVIARPLGRQMGTPEIDGVEPERADPAEQLVEALLVGLQRREVVVRRPVALRPAVQVPAGLACHVVGGHECDHGATEGIPPWTAACA